MKEWVIWTYNEHETILTIKICLVWKYTEYERIPNMKKAEYDRNQPRNYT